VKPDPHERARLLIALSGPEQVPNPERSWLAAHLDSCVFCREFAESTGETIRLLRAIPITAGGSLVSATRTRLRQRTQELQRQQERLRIVWVCSAAVRDIGFVVLCLMPAVVTGILMLARGTYLADHKDSFEG
jgi:hypothetical protein